MEIGMTNEQFEALGKSIVKASEKCETLEELQAYLKAVFNK